MPTNTAIVTGIGGQDAYYLTQLLTLKGCHVVGTTRSIDQLSRTRLELADGNLTLTEWDLCDASVFAKLLQDTQPTAVFNLAAYSSGAEMNRDPGNIAQINGMSVLTILDVICKTGAPTKLIQASSSEVFGITNIAPQDESTCRNPRSAYGVAKVFADSMVKLYRQEFSLFSASAILYNHESPLRGPNFVSQKIAAAVADIFLGGASGVVLGNLDAKRDWGHARDYMAGLVLMAEAPKADDYVFATGECRSVREFVEIAFGHVGISICWTGNSLNEVGRCQRTGRVLVSISDDYYRPTETLSLVGDASKAKANLGWHNSTRFDEMVCELVDAQIDALISHGRKAL